MLNLILKYFFIILCSIYIYVKLQNICLNKKQIIFQFLFSLIFSVPVYFTREFFSYITIIIIVLALIVFLHFLYKETLNKIITFTIISVGISYLIYYISMLIMAPICYIILNNLGTDILDTVSDFIFGCSQIIFIYLLFKIKRLSKGISAYESKLTSDLGAFISISLLLVISFADVKTNEQEFFIIIGTVIVFCVLSIGILLLFWWRKHIKNIYLEKVSKRNTEILENAISEQKELNDELKKQNEELSKIIHRDNKMIPAMELAVEEILNCRSSTEQKEKSKSLINQLKAMSSERTEIITEYENLNKHLQKTNIISIDASIKYLLNKAIKNNTTFDLTVTTDVKNIITDLVNENDLNTLILDLGENAVIAVSTMNTRNILMVLGIENNCFSINIYDSGNQFEPYVISNLGLKRVTTHKKTGGSGIGLMTTFELLKKYNASFVLDEAINNQSYSKKVSVCFDGLNQYRIHTKRDEILNILKNRKDLILF